MFNRVSICLSLAAAFVSVAVNASETWPQFRGPTGQGHADATGLPLNWSEKQNITWKTAIHGKGWSSPVIWSNQIWMTTATEDGHELFVVCVDRTTGKIVRDKKLFHVEKPQFIIPFNSPASPTPVMEQGRIYVTFGSPGTACLDTETGEVLWERRDLECNHFRGAGSSPILHGDMLIMHFDGSDFQYVVALDKRTGKTIWKTNRSIDFKDLNDKGLPDREGDWRKAFSTPTVASFNGKQILISPGSKACYAYDPQSGAELWRIEERKFYSASVRPSVGNGLIYFVNGVNKPELWALKPGGSGVLSETNIAWKAKRNISSRASFLLRNELIFLTSDNGITSCLDARTGGVFWEQEIGDHYSASPICAENRIYFFSEEGKTTVIEAKREFKRLAENKLDDGFMASPAVAGRELYLRTRTSLYRVESAK